MAVKKTELPFKVGDIVIASVAGSDIRSRVKVQTIGNKYITTIGLTAGDVELSGTWSQRKFYIDTRAEKTNYAGGGWLYTEDEWKDEDGREAKVAELSNDYGILFSSYKSKRIRDALTLEQLDTIIGIMKDALGKVRY